MENDMSKTHEYFQKELGLDKKTSEAIKILMNEGLLEPLLVDLRNALEAEEYQNTTSGIKFDPGKEDLIKRGFSPEEAEEWLQIS
jgi:hypothetical protein